MTLRETIEKMTGNKLSVNEALSLAHSQWGAVVSYVRAEDPFKKRELKTIQNQNARIKELEEENKNLKNNFILPTPLKEGIIKMVDDINVLVEEKEFLQEQNKQLLEEFENVLNHPNTTVLLSVGERAIRFLNSISAGKEIKQEETIEHYILNTEESYDLIALKFNTTVANVKRVAKRLSNKID